MAAIGQAPWRAECSHHAASTDPRPGACIATLTTVYRYFNDRADLTDPLDLYIQAAVVRGAGRAERIQRLRGAVR